MDRRSVIVTFVGAAIAGCGRATDDGIPDNQPGTTPTERTGVTAQDNHGGTRSTSNVERNAVLSARWVEFLPEDSEAEPYPSDEPPVDEHDVLLNLFDRAVEQDEWEPPGTRTRTSEPRIGEIVSEEIDREHGRDIANDLDGLDNYSEPDPTGRYFDHDDTLVAFRMVFQE